MDRIVLKNLPMPPSVNESLISRGCFKEGKIKTWISSSLISERFKYEMGIWRLKNLELVSRIKPWIQSKKIIRVDLYCGFSWKRVFTQQGYPKVLDAHNRQKLMHDRLAEILAWDDKHFFSGDCEKVTVSEGEQESATVVLSACNPRSMSEVLESLEMNRAGNLAANPAPIL